MNIRLDLTTKTNSARQLRRHQKQEQKHPYPGTSAQSTVEPSSQVGARQYRPKVFWSARDSFRGRDTCDDQHVVHFAQPQPSQKSAREAALQSPVGDRYQGRSAAPTKNTDIVR